MWGAAPTYPDGKATSRRITGMDDPATVIPPPQTVDWAIGATMWVRLRQSARLSAERQSTSTPRRPLGELSS
jgi:hypothetical protein